MKNKLSTNNLAMYKKSLQHWDTLLAGWIEYFDLRYNSSDLASFLKDTIKKSSKLTPSLHFVAGGSTIAIQN